MKNIFIALAAIFFGVIVSIFLAFVVGVLGAIAALVAYWRGLLQDILGLWNPEKSEENAKKSIWDIHQARLDAKRPK